MDCASDGVICAKAMARHTKMSFSFTVCSYQVGGILYSAGVVFHLWDQLRFQNAIWHAFVVAAAAFQYAAVFSSVLAATA